MLNLAITLLSTPRLIADDADEGFLGKITLRVRGMIRYYRAMRALSRLDQRDLDDLAIGSADFPALARRHATGAAPLARLYD
jgi:uncharacterized protein YjiS (DUF1127 family)